MSVLDAVADVLALRIMVGTVGFDPTRMCSIHIEPVIAYAI